MDGSKPAEESAIDRILSRGKDSVALMRDALLLILGMLLLLFPTTFNDVLAKAGFEEGSFAGLKWKAKLVETTDQLSKAEGAVKDLQKQLDKTTRLLNSAQAQIGDEKLSKSIAVLNQENTQVKVESSKVQASVASTITANAALVEKARASIGAETLRRMPPPTDARP